MNKKIVQFFKGFKIGMSNFSLNVSTIVNVILLTIVYVIGIGATSIVAKVKKKSFLDIKNNPSDSFWRDLNLKKKNREEYYRQF